MRAFWKFLDQGNFCMAVTDFGYKLIAKPNNSMSPRDTLMLVMGLATLSFVIAIAFARIGAWLVLPLLD